jgi:hypothetical protein
MHSDFLNRSPLRSVIAQSSAAAVIAGLGLCLLASPAARAQILTDGGFETTQLSSGSYEYVGGMLNGWLYSGLGVLINVGDGSPWTNPEIQTGYGGNQVAGIQNTGALSQMFAAPATGVFDLTWVDDARPGYSPQNYTVSLFDNSTSTTVASQTLNVTPGPTFALESLDADLVGGDTYTVTFQGLGSDPPGDATAFIDNVDLSAAPAPVLGVLPLPLSAAFFAGFVWLHRRRMLISA